VSSSEPIPAPRRARPPPFGWVALTGSPGVGKSVAARFLPSRYRAVEVSSLALSLGCGHRLARHGVEVDVALLSRRMRASPPPTPRVVVGHLAHLLPVDRAVVLRCHPRELLRRLGKRSAPAAWRRENVASEAIDLIVSEARARLSLVDEVDTTRRTPRGSAREVVRCLESPRPRAPAEIDWLADPWVTEYLLPSRP